jgi:peptidylprolyl isomerase
MAKKSLTKRDAWRAARTKRKQYTRIITIGIVVLGVLAITWFVTNGLKSQRTPGQSITPSSNPVQSQSQPIPELVGTKQYSAAPPMIIDVARQYSATVKMVKGGEFVIQLYPDKAPITVNNFVFLARQGYFDNVTFHRVLEGFMAQTGDPTGIGSGDPGYEFVNETNDLSFDKAGVVAMANAGRDTNGSQFFITFGAVGLTENDYTIFGQVISGMDVVNSITRRDPTKSPTFIGDGIKSITITEK